MPLITHLRIVDGKITHHTDHVDYRAAELQIAEQVESHNQEHGTEASFPGNPVDNRLLDQARDYLAALHKGDQEKLEAWLNPESVYTSYSAEAVSGSIERIESDTEILAAFADSSAKGLAQHFHPNEDASFVAGPNVFVIGNQQVTTRGSAWGLDRPILSVQIPKIVHLRFHDGKVTHHAEYADLAKLLEIDGLELPLQCSGEMRSCLLHGIPACC